MCLGVSSVCGKLGNHRNFREVEKICLQWPSQAPVCYPNCPMLGSASPHRFQGSPPNPTHLGGSSGNLPFCFTVTGLVWSPWKLVETLPSPWWTEPEALELKWPQKSHSLHWVPGKAMRTPSQVFIGELENKSCFLLPGNTPTQLPGGTCRSLHPGASQVGVLIWELLL